MARRIDAENAGLQEDHRAREIATLLQFHEQTVERREPLLLN